jgi:hypothetical protein
LRSFNCFGKVNSSIDRCRLSTCTSALNLCEFGTSLSLRCCESVGSSLSVIRSCYICQAFSASAEYQIGSAISLRSEGRTARISCSVLDVVNFGSMISIRSVSRTSNRLSILDGLTLGSMLSTRGVEWSH